MASHEAPVMDRLGPGLSIDGHAPRPGGAITVGPYVTVMSLGGVIS